MRHSFLFLFVLFSQTLFAECDSGCSGADSYQKVASLGLSTTEILFKLNNAEINKLDDRYHLPYEIFKNLQDVSDLGQGFAKLDGKDNDQSIPSFYAFKLGEERSYTSKESSFPLDDLLDIIRIGNNFSDEEYRSLYNSYSSATSKYLDTYDRCKSQYEAISEQWHLLKEFSDCMGSVRDELETARILIAMHGEFVNRKVNQRINIKDVDSIRKGIDNFINGANADAVKEYKFIIDGYKKSPDVYDTLFKMGKIESGSKGLDLLKEKAGSWSTEDKLKFISLMGGTLQDGYDNKRTDQTSKRAKGEVTGTDMLKALSSRVQGNFNEKAGVCRDIASFQAQMLESLGMKNSFVVVYGTDADSSHATVYTEDPTTGKIHKFNYDAYSSTDEKGVKGLEQEWDGALSYKIYKPYGGQVAEVKSERGQILLESLKGREVLEKEIPFYTKPAGNQVSAVTVELGGNLVARGYTAVDSLGKQYTGVGVEATSKVKDANSPLTVDSSIAGSVTKINYISSNGKMASISLLYGVADVTAKGDIKAGNVIVKPYATGHVEASVEADLNTQIDYSANLQIGNSIVVTGNHNDHLSVDTSVKLRPGFSNISDTTLSSSTLAVDSAQVETEYTKNLGRVALVASTGLYIDNFGAVVTPSGGVTIDQSKVTVGVVLPVQNENTPAFKEVVTPTFTIKAESKVGKNGQGILVIKYPQGGEPATANLSLNIELTPKPKKKTGK